MSNDLENGKSKDILAINRTLSANVDESSLPPTEGWSSEPNSDDRLFNFNAIIANLHVSPTVLGVVNPAPVFNDSGKIVGFASLDLVNSKLLANVNIEYSSPERLEIEVDRRLYVH